MFLCLPAAESGLITIPGTREAREYECAGEQVGSAAAKAAWAGEFVNMGKRASRLVGLRPGRIDHTVRPRPRRAPIDNTASPTLSFYDQNNNHGYGG